MASTHKHIRSSTANKRPTTAIADGQIALNTNSTSPGLFFKDSTGATIIKVGPVHVGTTAPNVSPAAGGSSGNSTGEIWLDTSLTPNGVKIWNGASWTNATPIGSTTVQGLLELATNAETQTGTDPDRAVTPAGLQSKVSDSTSTTSSTTIASSTAVKAAYDLADAALPKAGGTVTGNLEIGTTGSLTFEGSTADGFETTLAVTDPTADRTITLPNVSGTVVTTGDTGTVTSTMLADEIPVSKLADGAARQLLQTDAAGTGVEWTSNIDVPGTLDVTGAAVFDSSVSVTGALTKSGNNVVTVGDTGTVTSAMIADGTIVDADINASAEISVSKLADGTARQLLQTDAAGTGVEWTSNIDIPGTLDVTSAATFDSTIGASAGAAATPSITFTGDLNTGIYSPGADLVGISTGGSERLRVDSTGKFLLGTSTPRTLSGTAPFQVETATNTANTGASLLNYSSAGNYPALAFGISLSDTPGTHVKPNSGTALGAVFFTGSDGSSQYKSGSYIAGFADGVWNAGSNNSGYLDFGTTPTGSTNPVSRMRLDSSGRLLVGASSSIGAGEVIQSHNTGGDNFAVGRFAASAGSGDIAFYKSRSGTVGTNTVVNNADSLGLLSWKGADGTGYIRAATIEAFVDGTPGTNDMPGRLVFSTTADGASSPTERMRIGSNGGISATAVSNDGVSFSNTNSTTFTSTLLSLSTYRNTSNSTYEFLSCIRQGFAVALSIKDSGNVLNVNNSYTGFSDIKLKENIVDSNSQWDDIKSLRVRNYNFKEETGHSTHRQIGLIAQEVETVCPHLVDESPDRDGEGNDLGTVTKNVNYSVLYMKAVKALQEAMERIEQLEAKVSVLESKP